MEQSQLVDHIHKILVSQLELKPDGSTLNRNYLDGIILNILSVQDVLLTEEEQSDVSQQVVDRILGLGRIEPLLNDPEITEILVNGTKSIYIEKAGKLQPADIEFRSDQEVLSIINRIVGQVGRRIDESSPLVDTRLPDGSRVNAIIPPLSLIGPVLSIRRFPADVFNLDLMVEKETILPEMAAFLQGAVEAKQNILISGGTGSGKTSTLNALSSCIPQQERVITIEDAAEIQLDHPHLVSLESRPANMEGQGEVSIRRLLKNSLRMRPDRIIVGEIRGGEALDMLQAMNTGHQGSITTVHANAALEALFRVETMVLMSEIELPHSAIQKQISSAINIVLQQERLRDGSRKVVSINELVQDQRAKTYQLQPIFVYDRKDGVFRATGYEPQCMKDFEHYQISYSQDWFLANIV